MDSSMIFDCIENGNTAKLEECLMGLNPRTGLETLRDEKGFTPLASAINFSQLQVLRRLHEFMAGHKQTIPQGSSDSNLLQLAIKNSKTGNGKKVLEFVLTQWGTQLAFIRNPQSGQSALHLAASRGLVEVFVFLLTRADRSVLYDELLRSEDNTGQNPLHLSASNKHVDVVRELLVFAPTLALCKDRKGETALHKPVEAGEKPIVQKILEHSPLSILETNNDHRNAYQLAKHKIDLQLKGIASHNTPSPNALEIELYLKEWILRHPGLDPATIRQLVFRVMVRFLWRLEYYLDLQIFEDRGPSYQEYLKTFSETHFDCEDWLELVRLPEFHCDPKSPDQLHKVPRNDARIIFDSLRERKVKSILEVTVPDCPNHPHSDETIIHCLQGLHVKHLDWRKPDLSVKTIIQAAPDVEELCLYSSGNQDMLIHWASYEGLYRLQKLRSVEITLPLVESGDMDREKTELERKLKELVRHNHPVPLMYDPDNGLIVQGPSACDCRSPRFKKVCVKVEHPGPPKLPVSVAVPQPEDQDTIVKKMKPILNVLSTFKTNKENACAYIKQHPVKIAVIDNGVASHLFHDIQGQSFIENDIESLSRSHWHTVTDYHGTQMAALIDMMNPFCSLYVAKACQGPINLGVPVGPAIKAIEWATNTVDADILCMSWTISSYKDEGILCEALAGTEAKRTVFAATGDKGAADAYPSDFESTIAIANQQFNGSGVITEDFNRAKFCLPGDDIKVRAPEYLATTGYEKTSGSSAATALAAGLASLILTCVRFAYYEEPTGPGKGEPNTHEPNKAAEDAFLKFRRQHNMSKVFNRMCTNERPKFVQPWIFFKDVEDMTFDERKDYLKKKFESALDIHRPL